MHRVLLPLAIILEFSPSMHVIIDRGIICCVELAINTLSESAGMFNFYGKGGVYKCRLINANYLLAYLKLFR